MKLNKLEIALGYKVDTEKLYKNFNDYYEGYCVHCRENRLVVAIGRDEFLEDLKQRDGQKEKFQKFADLMHTKGYNLGKAKTELDMSFDEVDIAIDGIVVEHRFFGKEYKETK